MIVGQGSLVIGVSLLESARSVAVVLEHGRCGWGACYFCGWGRKEAKTSLEELEKKYVNTLERYRGRAEIVKIFSSGSLLDPRQFPLTFVRFLIEKAYSYGFREVVIESRPDYITPEILREINVKGIKITVAIGLEVADNKVLELLNKNMRVSDYIRAANLLREMGFGVRTYVLVNPHPQLYRNKEEQRRLLRETIKLAQSYADSIVVINTYPHSGSRLFNDWLEGRWKPLDEGEFRELVESVLGELEAEKISDRIYKLGSTVIEIDHKNFNFKPRIPRSKRVFLRGVGREILEHSHFQVWQDYIVRFYKPPSGKVYALLLPCSYRKPYKRSKTHKAILSAISGYPWFNKLHLIVVSVPGVIPYELHDQYPFTSYDWPEWLETEEVKKDYIEVTKERIKNYLRAHGHHYKLFFAYFHLESETLEAIRQAFQQLGIVDKLIIVLDEERYKTIKNELGKERVGSSILRHPLALQRLREVLKAYLEATGI